MESIDRKIKIGSLVLDLDANQILHDQTNTQVEPRLVDVLHFLYRNHGQVVERETFNSEVWQGQVISDNALSRSISQLRKILALSEYPKPTIETIPKVGYRLIIPENGELKTSQDFLEKSNSKKSKKKEDKVDFTFGKVILFSVLTAIIFISYIFETFFREPDKIHFNQSTLTHSPGVEKLARFSPDGKSVAYVKVEQKSAKEFIYIVDPVTQQTSRLTQEAKFILNLAWSPDSNTIIYSHWNNIHERQCEISLLKLNDKEQPIKSEQVLSCSDRSLVYLAWDGSGEKIFFNDRKSFDRPYSVYSYSLASKRISQLTLPEQKGNFRGDYFVVGNLVGSRIAVARYLGADKLRLMIYDTRNDELLATNLISENLSSITWFGSEEKLLSVIDKQLHLYEPSSNSFRPFYFIGKNSSSINTDVDAKRIVFTESNMDINLQSFDLSTGEKIADITTTTSNELMPSFANLSNSVAYLSNQSGTFQIWIKDANGKHQKNSDSPVSIGLTPLKWSPDDQFILFQHKDEVFTLNLATQKIERIIDIDQKPSVANWSVDGEAIFYSSEKSGEWQIWRYELAKDKHQQITSEGGYSANQHTNGDLYVSRIHQSGLWRLPLDDNSDTNFSSAEYLFEQFEGTNWLSWQLSGDNIYYFSAENSEKGVFEYNIITDTQRLIFPFTDKHLRYFSVKENEAIFTISEDADGSIEMLTLVD